MIKMASASHFSGVSLRLGPGRPVYATTEKLVARCPDFSTDIHRRVLLPSTFPREMLRMGNCDHPTRLLRPGRVSGTRMVTLSDHREPRLLRSERFCGPKGLHVSLMTSSATPVSGTGQFRCISNR
jgi:hypothetical protein